MNSRVQAPPGGVGPREIPASSNLYLPNACQVAGVCARSRVSAVGDHSTVTHVGRISRSASGRSQPHQRQPTRAQLAHRVASRTCACRVRGGSAEDHFPRSTSCLRLDHGRARHHLEGARGLDGTPRCADNRAHLHPSVNRERADAQVAPRCSRQCACRTGAFLHWVGRAQPASRCKRNGPVRRSLVMRWWVIVGISLPQRSAFTTRQTATPGFSCVHVPFSNFRLRPRLGRRVLRQNVEPSGAFREPARVTAALTPCTTPGRVCGTGRVVRAAFPLI